MQIIGVFLKVEAKKMNILDTYKNELFEICTQHSVKQLYAFGSVLTDKFDTRSDIDFLIIMKENLEPLEKGERILQIWYEFEKLFDRKIDLLTDTAITNQYLLKEINRTKQLIYDRQSQEVLS